jgi:membrane-bound lytic murein transglycosylase B
MRLLSTRLITSLLISLCAITTAAAATSPSQSTGPARPNEAIAHFIKQYAAAQGLDPETMANTLNQGHYDQSVIDKITHPFEKKPWDFYKRHFITSDRIAHGLIYWQTHEKMLAAIEAKYGVPASIIVAIMGVETHYGEVTGSTNELDALTTLAFYYPPRQAFFQSELAAFLKLAQRERWDPTQLKGSYAGALGMPQFMPSSYLHYGVDWDQTGMINLLTNHDDATASIAYFLKEAGWQAKAPIASPITYNKPTPISASWISRDAKPTLPLYRYVHIGIEPTNRHIQFDEPAALIKMNNTTGAEYWLTFNNFKAIMRYNPRTTYALAVYLLSEAIAERHAHPTNPAQ